MQGNTSIYALCYPYLDEIWRNPNPNPLEGDMAASEGGISGKAYKPPPRSFIVSFMQMFSTKKTEDYSWYKFSSLDMYTISMFLQKL